MESYNQRVGSNIKGILVGIINHGTGKQGTEKTAT